MQDNSIVNWDGFEKAFLGKFGNQKTVATLMKELLSMRMGNKEKVQDFNQRFTTLLNSFSATIKPTKESLVEYYTATLYLPIAMFVKRFGKVTLVEKYEEANKIEAYLDSIEKHTLEPELKHTTSKRPLLLTKPKDEHSNELESVVKMVHKSSNKKVDMEKDKGTSLYILNFLRRFILPKHQSSCPIP